MKVLIYQFLKILVTGMDNGSGKLPGKTQGIGESRIDLNRFKKTQKQDHGQSIREKFDLSRMPMAVPATTSGIFDQNHEMNTLVFIRKA